MPPSEIAAQVMACLRRAQQQLAGRVQQTMAATVGGEDQVIEHVVEGYRQRFGEDQPDRLAPDPGVLGLGVIQDDDPPRHSPPTPARRYRAAPGGDDENFGDRNYLR